MDSNPKELEPFVESERLKRIKIDEDLYVLGIYTQRAVAVAVEHCLAGNKAKSQYFDKPLRAEYDNASQEQEETHLSEKELQKQREMFVAKLMIMQTNFNLNKKNKEKDDSA